MPRSGVEPLSKEEVGRLVYFYVGPQDIYQPIFEQRETTEVVLPSGGILQVETLSTDEVRVVSLMSTDPMDFLDPRYAPGNIISRKLFIVGK